MKSMSIALFILFSANLCLAGTTTTTTTNPDGSTTVEETTTPEPAAPAVRTTPKIIGPAGVTGTIRRSDRRQDRRLEEDLEDLKDIRDTTNRVPRRGGRRR